MLFSIVIILAVFYLLFRNPEWLLLLFFILTISAINFELPLGNIRFRPLLGLLLTFRSVFDNRMGLFNIIRNRAYNLVLLFFGYIIFLSWGKGTLTADVFRLISLSMVTAYLGFYAFVIRNSTIILEVAIVCSGMICLSDLIYTYYIFGNFPVQRLYYLFLDNSAFLEELNNTNHNFYGFICGIGFVMLFARFIWGGGVWGKLSYLLMPLLFLGVLMSTSRSSLLGLVIASFFILYIGSKDVNNRQRVYSTMLFSSVSISSILILFMAFQTFLDLDSSFVNNIVFRLIEEPVAVLRKNLGLQYNVQNLDAMDWRKESASLAWDAYLRLPFWDQLTGVGIGGYLQRNLGQNGLNPHNGILYILVESGLVGFLIYSSFFLMAIRYGYINGISPLLLVLVFIVLYSLGQNEELISATALLFISSVFANSMKYQIVYGR